MSWFSNTCVSVSIKIPWSSDGSYSRLDALFLKFIVFKSRICSPSHTRSLWLYTLGWEPWNRRNPCFNLPICQLHFWPVSRYWLIGWTQFHPENWFSWQRRLIWVKSLTILIRFHFSQGLIALDNRFYPSIEISNKWLLYDPHCSDREMGFIYFRYRNPYPPPNRGIVYRQWMNYPAAEQRVIFKGNETPQPAGN